MKISNYRIISPRKLSGQIFFDTVEKIRIDFKNHFYNNPNWDLIVDLNMKAVVAAAVAKLFRFWFYISIWRDEAWVVYIWEIMENTIQ